MKRWQARAADGRVRFDAAQEAVVHRLDRLHDELGGYKPPGQNGGWRSLLKRERRREQPRGLYIRGRVGRGKSMLMDLFFQGAPIEQKRRVHFHAFMAEVHGRLHHLRESGKARTVDLLPAVAQELAQQIWLLCFDEFVVNDIADAMILGRLFEQLLELGVVVVATSNFTPDELYKDGLQRERFLPFIKLLKEKLDVVSLDGPVDYRLDRLRGRPVYHSPLGPEADAAIDRAWADLTDEDPGAPAELTVHGRKVTLSKAAKGVVRASFAELCERPLGASDYLALAGRFHTLLLEQVPELSAARHNEARRFITLIDALYEAKTRLVMSAAAPPEALYPDGRGAFEFQRTVSRLMEMQSADWVQRRAA